MKVQTEIALYHCLISLFLVIYNSLKFHLKIKQLCLLCYLDKSGLKLQQRQILIALKLSNILSSPAILLKIEAKQKQLAPKSSKL